MIFGNLQQVTILSDAFPRVLGDGLPLHNNAFFFHTDFPLFRS